MASNSSEGSLSAASSFSRGSANQRKRKGKGASRGSTNQRKRNDVETKKRKRNQNDSHESSGAGSAGYDDEVSENEEDTDDVGSSSGSTLSADKKSKKKSDKKKKKSDKSDKSSNKKKKKKKRKNGGKASERASMDPPAVKRPRHDRADSPAVDIMMLKKLEDDLNQYKKKTTPFTGLETDTLLTLTGSLVELMKMKMSSNKTEAGGTGKTEQEPPTTKKKKAAVKTNKGEMNAIAVANNKIGKPDGGQRSSLRKTVLAAIYDNPLGPIDITNLGINIVKPAPRHPIPPARRERAADLGAAANLLDGQLVRQLVQPGALHDANVHRRARELHR
jgi:hypothetical protein